MSSQLHSPGEGIKIKPPVLNRQKISVEQSEKIIKRKLNEEKAKQNYAERGTKRFISEGAEDRLCAVPYNINNLEKHRLKRALTIVEGDITSYHYGYYIRGVEKLVNIIKYPEIKPGLDIEAIGYNDSQDENINIELLPEEIKNCKEYLIGYKKGLEGKHKAK